jgi:hypothetical protein
MNKVLSFLLLVVCSTVLASIYGAAHDQITYTISPEYYTKFKFIQFGFEQTSLGNVVVTDLGKEYVMHDPRIGALIVGVMATWWFGLILGILLALVAVLRLKRSVFKKGFWSLLIAILVASLVTAAGYIYGVQTAPTIPRGWYLPSNVEDVQAFLLVGHIHNFSYAGGLLGLITGIAFLVFKNKSKQAIG